MRYNTLELTNLRLEKERFSTFPVLIQLVQNTKEMTGDTYYGTIGDSYNMAYSVELPDLPEVDANNSKRNINKLKTALLKLKSVKLSRKDIFSDFYVLRITDYSSTSRSIGCYEFVPMVFIKMPGNNGYMKIPQNRLAIIKSYGTKEAFLIIDKGASDIPYNNLNASDFTDSSEFIVDIRFKRGKVNPTWKTISKRIVNNKIEFVVTTDSGAGALTYEDLNRIRFSYDDILLENSEIFTKVEIVRDDGEILAVNKQLTKDDYFKFIYKTRISNVSFQDDERETRKYAILYSPALPIVAENLGKYDLITSDDIPDYRELLAEDNSIEEYLLDSRCSVYAIEPAQHGLCRLRAKGKENISEKPLFEIFEPYDKYERFVDVVKLSSSIIPFDINKYLYAKSIFNFDAEGFFEAFLTSGNKLTSDMLSSYADTENEILISFTYPNGYVIDDPDSPFSGADADNDLLNYQKIRRGTYPFSELHFDENVDFLGDPTMNIGYSNDNDDVLGGIIYPLDGDNPRVQSVIHDDEIRLYKTDGFLNIGFASEADKSVQLSDFRKGTGDNSVVVDKIREKHAAVINVIYDKTKDSQTQISKIKDVLQKSTPTEISSDVPDSQIGKTEIILPKGNFQYIAIYPYDNNNPNGIFHMKIFKLIDDMHETLIKNEYGCDYKNGPYIHLPFYLMTNSTDPVVDRSGSSYMSSDIGSFRIKIEFYSDVKMTNSLKCSYVEVF